MQIYRNFIGGAWHKSTETLQVIDPSDGTTVARIARGTVADISAAVAAAQSALDGEWGLLSAAERGRLLTRLSQLIRRDSEKLARLESQDVGKPLHQGRADASACARYFEFYGGAADKVHGDTIPYEEGFTVFSQWEPHGVTGHIIPWNYPMQIIGRSVGPALAMGNACVVKPAEDASLTALALARLVEEAGFPAGALNVVTGLGEEAGAALTEHPGIGHVSFTGSPEVGTLVQQAAAINRIPVTLELGGKSPHLVFADADLDIAAAAVVSAIVQNCGQTCAAGSRVLIEDAVYGDFTANLSARFSTLQAGPSDRNLDLGPLINAQQLARVKKYIDIAERDRLPIIGSGTIAPNAPEGGYYTKPILIGDVPPDHVLAQEEVFGPVLVAIRVRDEADALRVANGTPYGLVSGIWTKDIARAMRLSRKLRSGQVLINNYGAGGGIELPFGGMKGSGHGREKGFAALYGFASLKTVAVKHG
ncbi:aldehyde dehydrogenase family protein [Bradyrhizobium erythrophlei]|uniref:Aldehyde dehydrogenase (NAD+) n=1 Tax=Bradyrhizobium erythrophlei TaxID=1437360 RepID=A0A1H4WWG7_9BRAD|nr:aldehyde dehydrogenase family protein [Bradyrhizobium erythrophlei]SEC97575.1 aldehyde dehydrogenase (NAD+) [Bradyrhizobium erythrophlei]